MISATYANLELHCRRHSCHQEGKIQGRSSRSNEDLCRSTHLRCTRSTEARCLQQFSDLQGLSDSAAAHFHSRQVNMNVLAYLPQAYSCPRLSFVKVSVPAIRFRNYRRPPRKQTVNSGYLRERRCCSRYLANEFVRRV